MTQEFQNPRAGGRLRRFRHLAAYRLLSFCHGRNLRGARCPALQPEQDGQEAMKPLQATGRRGARHGRVHAALFIVMIYYIKLNMRALPRHENGLAAAA